jgi:hypothetical protein
VAPKGGEESTYLLRSPVSTFFMKREVLICSGVTRGSSNQGPETTSISSYVDFG